ncbi:hypothetical protein CCACVL1_07538 [Corchorus capsularis]|uniref:Uncharacterized protein n=1 Tax=Corchorus capsularis TaxID=210143 RepID=A0A1R3J5E1_COCAP|nr:hypothetical protein CCACVL1_07538 [Corchorus capsularis]
MAIAHRSPVVDTLDLMSLPYHPSGSGRWQPPMTPLMSAAPFLCLTNLEP